MLVEEVMTPAVKCRRMAALLRVKADRECDPEATAGVAVRSQGLSHVVQSI